MGAACTLLHCPKKEILDIYLESYGCRATPGPLFQFLHVVHGRLCNIDWKRGMFGVKNWIQGAQNPRDIGLPWLPKPSREGPDSQCALFRTKKLTSCREPCQQYNSLDGNRKFSQSPSNQFPHCVLGKLSVELHSTMSHGLFILFLCEQITHWR